MRVILDINIDGYETDEEHAEAVFEFIDELNTASVSVTLEGISTREGR